MLNEHLTQHQFVSFPLPAVVGQRGGKAVEFEVPGLKELEAWQLLLCARQLVGDVVWEVIVCADGIAADNEAGRAGTFNGRQRENIDRLIPPVCGDFKIGFLDSIGRHHERRSVHVWMGLSKATTSRHVETEKNRPLRGVFYASCVKTMKQEPASQGCRPFLKFLQSIKAPSSEAA